VTSKKISGGENNDLVGPNKRTGFDSCSDATPAFESAEAFEFLPFGRLPLWPFSWNRLFAQEDE